eukprot:evm.model.scf_3086.1 EVM.evm.TU.scf_3086.1   scf_3086:349-5490(-)
MASQCGLEFAWQGPKSEVQRLVAIQELVRRSQGAQSLSGGLDSADCRTPSRDCGRSLESAEGTGLQSPDCISFQTAGGSLQHPPSASPEGGLPNVVPIDGTLWPVVKPDDLGLDRCSAKKDNKRKAASLEGPPFGDARAACAHPSPKAVRNWPTDGSDGGHPSRACAHEGVRRVLANGNSVAPQGYELGCLAQRYSDNVDHFGGASRGLSARFACSGFGWRNLEDVLQSSCGGEAVGNPGRASLANGQATEGLPSIVVEQDIMSRATDFGHWHVAGSEQPTVTFTSTNSSMSFEHLASLPRTHPDVEEVLRHPDSGPLTRLALVGTSGPERSSDDYDVRISAKLGWDDDHNSMDWDCIDWAAVGQIPLGQRPLRQANGCQSAKRTHQTSSSDFQYTPPATGLAHGNWDLLGYESAEDGETGGNTVNSKADHDGDGDSEDDYESYRAAVKKSRRRLRIDGDRETILSRIVSAQISWCKGKGKACSRNVEKHRIVVQDERVLAGLCKDLRDNRDNKAALVFSLCMFSEPDVVMDQRAAVSTGLVVALNELVDSEDARIRSLANEILR